MNEEKQAIDWLKSELDDEKKSCKNCNYSYKGVTGLYGNNEVEIALKLIEKQQKEIERLKNLNKNTYIRKDTIEHIRDKAECMDYYSLSDVIADLTKLIGDKKYE